MRQRFKAHKLFRNNLPELALADNLKISEGEEKFLLDCRKDVRKSIRQGFAKIRDGLMGRNIVGIEDVKNLKPKFYTQGSFAYGTLNDPAINPPQQIDLDDGVYFLMEIVNNKPVAAKNTLLKAVQAILSDLAWERGWDLSTKSTCLRLHVNHRIHIDVPVYAIPEEKYIMLADARSVANESYNFTEAERKTTRLDPNEVHLARWDKDDWIISDPMELHDWFVERCQFHGQSLRRVCRYIKSWRDKNWEDGGPSSIAIMAAVVDAYDEFIKSKPNGDCAALLTVCQELPSIFARKITNPVNSESELFPAGLDKEESDEVLTRLRDLRTTIEEALCISESSRVANLKLQQAFGSRLPYNPDWIENISITETVRHAPKVAPITTGFPKEHRSG